MNCFRPTTTNLVRSFGPRRSPFSTTATATAYNPIHSPSTTSCPTCHAPIPTFTPLCPSCHLLLPPPPPSTTNFTFFSLSPSFSLDQKALKNEYRNYQQKVHPDLFLGKGGEREDWAKVWSRRVNDAFRCLEGDRTRAEYLLSLSNVTIGEADPVTNPDLLMAIMEVREQLEEATSEEEVKAIRYANQLNINQTLEQLKFAFETNPSTPESLEEAKNLVIQLRYFENVEGVCREWAPGKRVELQH